MNTVALGTKNYTITSSTANNIELAGARGGRSTLTRNAKHPSMWGHFSMKGYRSSTTTWYVRNDDGTFRSADDE